MWAASGVPQGSERALGRPHSVSDLMSLTFSPLTLPAVGPAVQAALCADLHRTLADHLGLGFPRFCPALRRATYPAYRPLPGWGCAEKTMA